MSSVLKDLLKNLLRAPNFTTTHALSAEVMPDPPEVTTVTPVSVATDTTTSPEPPPALPPKEPPPPLSARELESLKPSEPFRSHVLAVAAIHATLLAIFLGVLSTYGFYRHTVRDQLEMKLFQEANEINTIRFETRNSYGIPEQALTEAEQLSKSTSLIQRVERLKDIIREGKNINPNLPLNTPGGPDNAVADRGKEAFQLIFAVLLRYPFPEATESRSDPRPVPFSNIATIQSWVAELQQVTRSLIRAHEEDASDGLKNVLLVYSRLKKEYPQYIIEAFHDSFFKSLTDAHGIRHRVTDQLQEIDRHQKSGIGKGWLAVGFFGALLTFGISVLVPLHNSSNPNNPKSWKSFLCSLQLWEPTIFYIVALVSIAYLIFV